MKVIRPVNYSKSLNKTASNKLLNKWGVLLDYLVYFIKCASWKIHLLLNRADRIDFTKIKPGAIPVLLNNFNRLETLQEMILWLRSLNTELYVIIVDNKSTFPPLLDYYKSLKSDFAQVMYVRFNSGHFGIRHYFKYLVPYGKIVISDCDLIPYKDTPKDVLNHLSVLLDKYPEYNHVGVSLEIEDIPDTYPLKPMVVAWEKRYWPPFARIINDEAYEAKIDTTFGMWRSDSVINPLAPALRTKFPYRLKHTDWYINPQETNQEYQFYISTCSTFGSWTKELIRWKETQNLRQSAFE